MLVREISFVSPLEDALDIEDYNADPFIIVKKMTKEIIEEAIQAYAADKAYWLKFYHFGREVNIDVFNQLESEHIEELKEIDELIKEDLKALGKLDESNNS